jgi:hypothetical protein
MAYFADVCSKRLIINFRNRLEQPPKAVAHHWCCRGCENIADEDEGDSPNGALKAGTAPVGVPVCCVLGRHGDLVATAAGPYGEPPLGLNWYAALAAEPGVADPGVKPVPCQNSIGFIYNAAMCDTSRKPCWSW